MNQKFFSSLFFLTLSGQIYAEISEQQQIQERLNDHRFQTETQQIPTPKTIPVKAKAELTSSAKSISISKEELSHHPSLVVRAMIPAVMQNNAENVALLYPIYQKLPTEFQDPILEKWIKAILVKQHDHSAAIALYREVLAQNSEITMARLQLAIALFENNENDAAEDQFQKVRSENIPEELKQGIDQYLSAIAKQDRWVFSGGVTYLNDPNINNAPKNGTTYGKWTAPKSESAQGFGFNFNVGKKWSWGNGIYNEFRLDTNGKYYWNNHKYNEFSGRGSFGLGYQNARTNLALLPFMEQTLYAGGSSSSDSLKRFSKTSGTTLEFSHWFSPKWQFNSTYEYAEVRYMDRKHLNGNYHFISTGLTYLANAKQYWFTNLSYNRTATRDKDDSYMRRGVSLGWGQEWSLGLSTRLSLSYVEKDYKGPMPIFNITQRNKEYGLNASIWHRAIHYWGITPRVTYSFNKVKSNHVFYSYDKHRAFIEFNKRF
ncbi:surface lipoprotein assembly modifier [Actinobacillus equuli]|uniref:surface lipoprotein assembly modifier n=1 Tax=Actinobacillus equuli TaxID=718 RepID=UPI00244291E8|nr:surface lipoprotein assembly modifier [Actinobacillus equuli]WGE57980.1 surface lipoprotein assembly modifier [Actinobacillus equuli subsp. equuli]